MPDLVGRVADSMGEMLCLMHDRMSDMLGFMCNGMGHMLRLMRNMVCFMRDGVTDMLGLVRDGMPDMLRLVYDRMADVLRFMGNGMADILRLVRDGGADRMVQVIGGVLEGLGIDRNVEIGMQTQAGRDITADAEVQMVMGVARMGLSADAHLADAPAGTGAFMDDTADRPLHGFVALGARTRRGAVAATGTICAMTVLDSDIGIRVGMDRCRSAAIGVDRVTVMIADMCIDITGYAGTGADVGIGAGRIMIGMGAT